MTNKEAIEILRQFKKCLSDVVFDEKGSEAWQMAIQALSQEPCDDAVSRKDIQDYIAKYLSQYLYEDVRQAVEVIDTYIGDMPPVTQKSGKWINDKNDLPICSRCGYIPPYDRAIDDYEYSNYCPSCGCRMVEPQESEG